MGLGRKERKQLEEITKNIESGLTGNSDNDMKYLDRQCAIYSRHELSEEILGVIKEKRMALRSNAPAAEKASPVKNKVLEDIIKDIRTGLTGDREKDMKYLDGQSSKYSRHPLNEEILREIKRMRFETLPEEKKAEMKRSVDESGLNAIMSEIKAGLMGKPVRDKRYLEKQIEKYKNHELADEIKREIGLMMNSLSAQSKTNKPGGGRAASNTYVPEVNPVKKERVDDLSKDEVKKAIDGDLRPVEKRDGSSIMRFVYDFGVDRTIDEAIRCYKKEDFAGALQVIEIVLKKTESKDGKRQMYMDYPLSDYRCFRNAVEQQIYIKFIRDQRESQLPLMQMDEDFSGLYEVYGVTLFELRRFNEARTALEKAIRANPLRMSSRFELAEISKAYSDWDEYLQMTKDCMIIAYKGTHLARCYRNLGYYYVEMRRYHLAAALLHLALYYEPGNEVALNELGYAEILNGEPIPKPSMDDIERLCDANGIHFGPNRDILDICVELGENFQKEGYNEAARFCVECLYSMTYLDSVKALLDAIPRGNKIDSNPNTDSKSKDKSSPGLVKNKLEGYQ